MMDADDSHRTDETRRALIEQLAHLADEVRKLRRHVDLIPESVQSGRPLQSDLSFKELYALLALFDEQVFGPALTRFSEHGSARVDTPPQKDLLAGTGCNDDDLGAILDRVASSRERLVDQVSSLSLEDWLGQVTIDGDATDGFGFVFAVIHHDSELLRKAAYRLHESRLTTRQEDLPK